MGTGYVERVDQLHALGLSPSEEAASADTRLHAVHGQNMTSSAFGEKLSTSRLGISGSTTTSLKLKPNNRNELSCRNGPPQAKHAEITDGSGSEADTGMRRSRMRIFHWLIAAFNEISLWKNPQQHQKGTRSSLFASYVMTGVHLALNPTSPSAARGDMSALENSGRHYRTQNAVDTANWIT
jgi:hypothetical protein